MKALIFNIRPNSLYSIRVPFTWQSALTYPVLPPSAVIGLIANALQRYKNNKHPIEYLKEVENEVVWAGSRLLSSCVIKSYTTSAITKWEEVIGGKFTNAIGRQFAYSKNLQIAAILKNAEFLDDLSAALTCTPLTCGDSESAVSLDALPLISDVEEVNTCGIFETRFPVPFKKEIKIHEGSGQIYLMHERCLKRNNEFPLTMYVVPIRENKGLIEPTTLKIEVRDENYLKIYLIKDLSAHIITTINSIQARIQKKKRRTRRKG